MKRLLVASLLVVLPTSAFARSESWSFVRSVGGIAVDPPVRSTSGWALPVHADVSGLETVTEKPTTINSALVCKSVDASVEGNRIYLTVVSGLASKNTSSRCQPAQLGNVAPGKYSVFYRGPNEAPVLLREVEFGF